MSERFEGRVDIVDGQGRTAFQFDADRRRIMAWDEKGHQILRFAGVNAQLYLGGEGNEGDLYIVHPSGVNSIQLDGNSGDIILRNADAAEEFDVASDSDLEPGSVVVLDDDGSVRAGHEPYDRRVAGVVSGAGDYRPAVLLDRKDRPARIPVAMMGKVACLVDATAGPVGVGDLLTTSETPGHAMLASDPSRSAGSVLGKAMGSLSSGTGLVPTLISLR